MTTRNENLNPAIGKNESMHPYREGGKSSIELPAM